MKSFVIKQLKQSQRDKSRSMINIINGNKLNVKKLLKNKMIVIYFEQCFIISNN